MKSSEGIIKQPYFVLIYGPGGVGKTTFVSEAPAPKIIDVEDGSSHVDVKRDYDIQSWDELLKSLSWFRNEKHDRKTLGLDTLDKVESLIFKDLCSVHKCSNVEEVAGGFQKGYVYAMDYWHKLKTILLDIRNNRGVNIVCVAHEKTVTVNDPVNQLPFDRHTLKLHENKQVSAIAFWREAVDALLFATFEDQVAKVNAKDKKGRAFGEGVRKLYATRTGVWDAKNRLGLPREIPFSLGQMWNAFDSAAQAGRPDSIEQVRADINSAIEFFRSSGSEYADRITTALTKVEALPDDEKLKRLIGIRNSAQDLQDKAE